MEGSENNHDLSGGGFQNRDVGKSNFRKDFGNDFGVDFARFSNPLNLKKDDSLAETIEKLLKDKFKLRPKDIFVRNDFIFMKFQVINQDMRDEISESVSKLEGVENVLITSIRNLKPIRPIIQKTKPDSSNTKLTLIIRKKMNQFLEKIKVKKK